MEELRETLGDIPLLFTFRTLKEGGEKEIEKSVYVKLNEMAVKTGFADLVDAEAFTGTDEVNTIVETAHLYGVKVIASNHDFQKTPPKEEIVSRLCFMQECGADIVKIAVMPQSKKDVLTLLLATEEMVREHAKCPVVTMSMSEVGVVSRICGEAFGSALTFGAEPNARSERSKKRRRRDSSGQKSFEWCLKSCMTFDKRAINFDEKLVALSLWMFL